MFWIKRTLIALVGIGISLGAIFYIYEKINWSAFWDQIQSVPFTITLSLFLIYFLANLIRGIRYQLLLDIPYKTSLSSIYIGYCFNNLLPLRLGEIARGLFIAHRLNVSKTTSITTVAVERAFDGATVVLMLGLSAWALEIQFFKTMLTLGIILFGGVLLLFYLSVWKEQWLLNLLNKLLPFRVMDLFQKIIHGFHSLKDLRKLFLILVTSLLGWIIEGSMFGLLLWVLDIRDAFWIGYLCCAVVNLSILVPSAPGYVGVYQAAFVICFIQLGLNENLGFSASFIIHATQFILTTTIGIIILTKSKEGLDLFKKVWYQKASA